MNKVFVYGILRDQAVATHILRGGIMFDVGAFPAVKLSPNTERVVYGNLLEVGDAMLGKLDTIEGYYQLCPEVSLYLRKETLVYDIETNEEIEAFIYEANFPVREYEVVEPANWIDYLHTSRRGHEPEDSL